MDVLLPVVVLLPLVKREFLLSANTEFRNFTRLAVYSPKQLAAQTEKVFDPVRASPVALTPVSSHLRKIQAITTIICRTAS